MLHRRLSRLSALALTMVAPWIGLVLLFGSVGFWAQTAHAQESGRYLTVATSGSDTAGCGADLAPCRTIQYAVDKAVAGDEIRIASGVYTGVHNTYSGLTQVVYFVNKDITVRGGYTTTNWKTSYPSTQPTVLDAEGKGRVIAIVGDIGPTIANLTITHGDAKGLGLGYPPHSSDPNDTGDAGGGVYLEVAKVIFENCQFISNTAQLGGGVFSVVSSSVFRNNRFVDNYADACGGVDAEGWEYGPVVISTTFEGNVFENNVTEYIGGGLCTRRVNVTMISNTVLGNSSSTYDGGVHLEYGSSTLKNNKIFSNTTTVDGGGLTIMVGSAVVDGNLIKGNNGSGILLGEVDVVGFYNNIIANNGIGVRSYGSSGIFFNNTIVNNTTGLWLEDYDNTLYNSYLFMTNTLFADNQLGILVDKANSITLESTYWGNTKNWSGDGTIVTGTHNYYGGAVGFVDAPHGNYHLSLPSAVIDRGIAVPLDHDYDGDPRPLGNGFDIGADESGLGLAVKSEPVTAHAGASLTYTIAVTNYTYWPLTTTVTDLLPDHVTPGGTLTWTPVIPAAGGVWKQTVPVTVQPAYGGPLTNVTRVSTAEGATGVYTLTTPAVSIPRLSASIRAIPEVVHSGDWLTYTLRVTNSGDMDLHTVITDILPERATPGGWLTWSPVITWPGGVWTKQVPVKIDASYKGTMSDVLRIASAEGATGVYTLTTTVEGVPGLSAGLQASPAKVKSGETLTYTFAVTNTGNVDLHTVITGTLPEQVTPGGVLTWSPVITAPGGVWRQTVPVTVDPLFHGQLTGGLTVSSAEGATDTVTHTVQVEGIPGVIASLEVFPARVMSGETFTYTFAITNTGNVDLHTVITGTLPDHVTTGGVLTWTAQITAPGGVWRQAVPLTVDPLFHGQLTGGLKVSSAEGATDAVTRSVQVVGIPGVIASLNASPARVKSGETFTYTFAVTNTGNVDLHTVITGTLPEQVTPGGVLTWSPVITAPGGVWRQTVPVTVDPLFHGQLTGGLTVSSAEGATDTVTHTVQVEGIPGVIASLEVFPARVMSGETFTYTFAITNTGNVDLHTVITGTLPDHVTTGGVLTWTAQITAPGGVWRQAVPLTVDPLFHGQLTGGLKVSSAEGATDAVTRSVQVVGIPGVIASLNASPARVKSGETFTYTFAVTNTGNVDLHTVITGTLPDHVTPGGALTWSPVITAPGGVWRQAVPLTVDPFFHGQLTGGLMVSSAEGPTDAVTRSVQVEGIPGVIASLRAFPARVKSGETFTYTFAVTNTGNVDLHTVITGTLPDHVTPGGALTWSPVITAPGGVWRQVVPVTVDPLFHGQLTGVLTVSSAEGQRMRLHSPFRWRGFRG